MSDSLPLVIANLKANKTWEEVSLWLDQVGQGCPSFKGTIVLCPSYPFLTAAAQKIKSESLKIKLGSQDLSKFEKGSYTGEVASSQIADLCQYSIIGHSERRQNFAEDDHILAKKAANAKAAGLVPIFCVQNENTPVPKEAELIAYEPLFAIGTGNPDTPQNAATVAKRLKDRGNYTVIYGGSVTPPNVKNFLKKGVIDGVLVGNASLDAESFIDILESASGQ